MKKWLAGRKLKRLEQEYRRKLQDAQSAQRGGDMPRFAELTAAAESIGQKVDELRAARD